MILKCDANQAATTSKIVVEKSTVPVRTAHAVKRVLAAAAKDGVSYQVGELRASASAMTTH